MGKNLVIVESPAKAKTLEQFLGKDYRVMSSYGHIRDLKSHSMSVNLKDFTPEYEIPDDKRKVVDGLMKASKSAETVWLASDEDREGEAISWHLAQVLGLSVAETKRIVFHEITKNAILEAIERPRHIDMNLVNAQQARRVLDRIVGFTLSPVLWRKLKPSLSAGRVQSVAVRLIVEREREIEGFKQESAYRVTGDFVTEGGMVLKAELSERFATEGEAQAFLESCEGRTFEISDIQTKPLTRVPAPPFTTSTLQQEAARKLGFSVAQTMSVAQRLYESGKITYMRTDSVNLSSLCVGSSKKEIVEHLGEKYSKPRKYQTRSKGAQEAHEAIRPTYMSTREIKGSTPEKRLYELIWKRTLASQMADAEVEKTVVRISLSPDPSPKRAGSANADVAFVASAEKVVFDGFLRVYRESFDDEGSGAGDEGVTLDGSLKQGESLTYKELTATQRFSQHPPRYNEAALVHKLEELGIGRPSTYAPTISTIQQRGYVEKGNVKGEKRQYTVLSLQSGKRLKRSEKSETAEAEKNKLIPTDIGTVVNDFLVEKFPTIVDFNFTAKVEQEFDRIAEGKDDWHKDIKKFYNELAPQCEQVLEEKQEHKVGERILGTDPATGKPVSVKIGRFGPMAQIGQASEGEKPRFAQLKQGQSIQTITLEEALELFKLPRVLGEWEGSEVSIGTGRFGPYVLHAKKYTSLPKGADPMSITLEEAIAVVEAKRKADAQKVVKTFADAPDLQILNGRFGPYIKYQGSNYKLPKTAGDPQALTAEKCMEIVNGQGTTKRRKRN